MFVFLRFLFFKQKTAYEMRISDWSSDVCSSDLEGPRIVFLVAGLGVAAADMLEGGGNEGFGVRRRVDREAVGRVRRHLELGHRGQAVGVANPLDQIGRASCRERVCKYV